jgi:hypothetical protein
MLRFPLASLLALTALTAAAQDTPPALKMGDRDSFTQMMAQHADEPVPLLGRVEVNTYIAPTGTFKIEIPISPALGGSITDTQNIVIFDDTYLTHITLANYPLDPTEKWNLSTSSPKEYLLNFFGKQILRNYREAFKNVQIRVDPLARFLPTMYGGAFIAYLTIPGGSFFSSRVPQVVADPKPRDAKYGVLLFVQKGYVFIISMEFAEHAIEGSANHLSNEREDTILRGRLLDFASKIEFTEPPKRE